MPTITQKLIPSPTKRRPGIPIQGVKFIVMHDTGNDGSTALNNVNYYINTAKLEEASAHFFVDDLGIINCIPETEKAYHVRRITTVDNERFGCDSIDYALSIELCYGSNWSKERNMKSYNNYVELTAYLCKKYNLDPRTKLVGHNELDPTRRTDPLNAFSFIKVTWSQFINDVIMKMGGINPPVDKEKIKKDIINLLNQL